MILADEQNVRRSPWCPTFYWLFDREEAFGIDHQTHVNVTMDITVETKGSRMRIVV